MSSRMFTCPKCNGEFALPQIMIVKEFPCPNCDAVLRLANREETWRRMKAYGILLLISCISYTIFLFTLVSTQDAYLVIQRVCVVSSVVLPIFASSAIAMERLNRSLRLEVVRIRHSCKNCGYIISVGNPRFCPRCGAFVLPDSRIYSSLGEQTGTPEARQQSYLSMDLSGCTICGKGINRGDASIQCPGCGNTFHRAHMLEYLHVHGRCPLCGRHLNENELIQEVLPEATRLGKGDK